MRIDNPLEKYFRSNKKRLIHKWLHYFEIYHRHFERFRGKPVTVVEFGVSQGGSLQMWKHYFGPRARIIGIDVNPDCAMYVEPQIEVLIGSQLVCPCSASQYSFFGELIATNRMCGRAARISSQTSSFCASVK